MKQNYSFWTSFITLRDLVREYLKKNNIEYELSGSIADYYFSITATADQADAINAFIESVTITEV